LAVPGGNERPNYKTLIINHLRVKLRQFVTQTCAGCKLTQIPASPGAIRARFQPKARLAKAGFYGFCPLGGLLAMKIYAII
jgi:hypothetical protein